MQIPQSFTSRHTVKSVERPNLCKSLARVRADRVSLSSNQAEDMNESRPKSDLNYLFGSRGERCSRIMFRGFVVGKRVTHQFKEECDDVLGLGCRSLVNFGNVNKIFILLLH